MRHGFDNGKGSLQLGSTHSFLLADSSALVGLELRGTRQIDETNISLTPQQIRLDKAEVRAIPTEFPTTITGAVSVATDGRRVLKLEREEYLFASDRATVPDPWDTTVNPQLTAMVLC